MTLAASAHRVFPDLGDEIPDRPPEEAQELRIAGASLVLYDFACMDRPVDLARLGGADFEPVDSKHSYFDKVLELQERDRGDHVRFLFKKPIHWASPDEIAPAFSGHAKLFLTVLRKQFLLIETVIVIDHANIFSA